MPADYGPYDIQHTPSYLLLQRDADGLGVRLYLPSGRKELRQVRAGKIPKPCAYLHLRPDALVYASYGQPQIYPWETLDGVVTYGGQIEIRSKGREWLVLSGRNAEFCEWFAKAATARAQHARGEAITGIVAPTPRATPFEQQLERDSIELRSYPEGIWLGRLSAVLLLGIAIAGGVAFVVADLQLLLPFIWVPVFFLLSVAAIPVATSFASARVRVATDASGVTAGEQRFSWGELKSVKAETEEGVHLGGFQRSWLVFETDAGEQRVRVGIGVGRKRDNLDQLKQAASALDARIPRDRGSPEDVPAGIRELTVARRPE